MLDFLDKDFKTTVITILWEVRENILEMNEKREFLWKVIKAIKWNKWKNTYNWKYSNSDKNSLKRFNSRVKMTKKRIVNLKYIDRNYQPE